MLKLYTEENQKIFMAGPDHKKFGTNVAERLFSFLDDDDIWLPKSLVLNEQMLKEIFNVLHRRLIGEGIFNKADKYKLTMQHYLKKLSVFIENQNILNLVPFRSIYL